MNKLKFKLSASFIALLISPMAFSEDKYPEKPITMIVGFAAGGPTDQAARIIAQGMENNLGQQFVIENKPGANSTLSIKALHLSKPDGYTILIASNGVLTVAGARYKNFPFDANKDFVPIGMAAGYSHVLVVPENSKYTDVKSIISNADKDFPSISSVGNVDELTIALFQKLTNKKLNTIPYKGQSAVIPDLVSDRVNMAFLAPNVAKPLVESGKLKALAVSGTKRIESFSDIPTMEEAGVKGFDVEIWNALVAKPGTPVYVIDKLNNALKNSVNNPEVIKKLSTSGFITYPTDSKFLSERIESEGNKWNQLVKTSNIEAVDFK